MNAKLGTHRLFLALLPKFAGLVALVFMATLNLQLSTIAPGAAGAQGPQGPQGDTGPEGPAETSGAPRGGIFLSANTHSRAPLNAGDVKLAQVEPAARRQARGLAATTSEFAALCADRAALEHVYYNHRLGEKPPFEQALPPAALANLVRQDLRKEAALKQAYGVDVAPALLDAEVRRINTTTRAPEMLAEIKAALGNDPTRFARAMARPILVERLLREKFDNDDTLHATQRRQIDQTRNELLAARRHGSGYDSMLALLMVSHSNAVTQTTWQLGARPAETNAPDTDELQIKKRFGSNAHILSSPHAGAGNEQKFYFGDLPPELQNVLRVQLRQPGDVSAVIETPGAFLLYLAEATTATTLSTATLSLPKRSYEHWLSESSDANP